MLGEWHDPGSSKIKQYRHHEDRGEIEIVFHSGACWFYPCTGRQWVEFHSAASRGAKHHDMWVVKGHGRKA